MFHAGLRLVKSRHPLARLAAALIAVVLVIGLVAVGVFALAVLVVGGALFALVRALRAPRPAAAAGTATPSGVIEGEFTVVADGPARKRAPTGA
ncbi:hypothetical protein [Dokdonella sp.]|jgi:hypothetical protein|uniref:hypothetical protein n=1 Tax=Dokdonella sp. TaxID=2291710 RepID=UPI002F405A47